MITVVTVVGARPQFIKAAVVSRAFRRTGAVRELILHTGQHYDERLSEVFYRELGIPSPAFELGIGSGPHGGQTARMLVGIEEVLVAEQPDWVLVYGDTNSTLAGALAAAKLAPRLAHVEAGLRSFNRRMPEEINRIVTDHCADLLFAPTELSRSHLRREGIPDEKIDLVGDVMYDAAVHFGERSQERSRVLEEHAGLSFITALVVHSGPIPEHLCQRYAEEGAHPVKGLEELLRDRPMRVAEGDLLDLNASSARHHPDLLARLVMKSFLPELTLKTA